MSGWCIIQSSGQLNTNNPPVAASMTGLRPRRSDRAPANGISNSSAVMAIVLISRAFDAEPQEIPILEFLVGKRAIKELRHVVRQAERGRFVGDVVALLAPGEERGRATQEKKSEDGLFHGAGL